MPGDIFSGDLTKNGPVSGVPMGVFPAEKVSDSNVSVIVMQSFFGTKEGILGGLRNGALTTLLTASSSGVPDAEDRTGELRLRPWSKHRYLGVCGCSSSERAEASSLPSKHRFLFGLFPEDVSAGIEAITIDGDDGSTS